MKILHLAAFFWIIVAQQALAAHTVVLTFSDPDTTSTAPGTVTIYRATGACPSTGTPSGGVVLTSTLSLPGTATYTDSSVSVGSTYCYWGTMTVSGMSTSSNTFQGQITLANLNVVGTAQ